VPPCLTVKYQYPAVSLKLLRTYLIYKTSCGSFHSCYNRMQYLRMVLSRVGSYGSSIQLTGTRYWSRFQKTRFKPIKHLPMSITISKKSHFATILAKTWTQTPNNELKFATTFLPVRQNWFLICITKCRKLCITKTMSRQLLELQWPLISCKIKKLVHFKIKKVSGLSRTAKFRSVQIIIYNNTA